MHTNIIVFVVALLAWHLLIFTSTITWYLFYCNFYRLFQFRKIISRRETCFPLIPNDYPVEIIKEEKHQDYTILEGQFLTPLELHLPGIVPKQVQDAHFQVVIPRKWKDQYKPICIHLAGTGDHVCECTVLTC